MFDYCFTLQTAHVPWWQPRYQLSGKRLGSVCKYVHLVRQISQGRLGLAIIFAALNLNDIAKQLSELFLQIILPVIKSIMLRSNVNNMDILRYHIFYWWWWLRWWCLTKCGMLFSKLVHFKVNVEFLYISFNIINVLIRILTNCVNPLMGSLISHCIMNVN